MIDNQQYNTLFPSVPRDRPATDENGDFTALWELFFGEMAQALQTNFKNEGIVFPSLVATDLATIQSLYAPFIGQPYNTLVTYVPDISGQTVFDTTNRVPKQFIIKYDSSPSQIVLTAQWWSFTLTYP
jgi:hypothetical protein